MRNSSLLRYFVLAVLVPSCTTSPAASSEVDAATDSMPVHDAAAGDAARLPDGAPTLDAAADAAIASDTGSTMDASVDAPRTCAAGEHACGASCVSDLDPSFGCGALTCAPCALPDATATCSSRACAISVCATRFADCDSLASNGCETNTTSSDAHCGACGTPCPGGQHCIASVCQLPFTCTAVDGSTYAPIVSMAGDLTGDGTRTLASVMAAFPNAGMRRTPGVTIAVRDASGTVHAAVFGDANNAAFDASAPALSPTTLFQAGSVSKPISALAYLTSEMADATRSTDIRPTIASVVMPTYVITPTDLLSHTAGTSVHGFAGYAPGLALPTIDQIVLGVSPANSLPVTFGTPGPWLYSGGGYILWEDWLERTTGQSLPTFVHDRLFVPSGATRSSYAQPLPATEHDAACGSDPAQLASNCRHVYPESAAAGLWTTPTELACMAGYVTSRRPDALGRVQARAVTIPGSPLVQGLGLTHRPANGIDETAGHFYAHTGVNAGFCTTLAFFSDGRAIVSMDDSCAGVSTVVVRALCVRLGWTCGGANLAAH